DLDAEAGGTIRRQAARAALAPSADAPLRLPDLVPPGPRADLRAALGELPERGDLPRAARAQRGATRPALPGVQGAGAPVGQRPGAQLPLARRQGALLQGPDVASLPAGRGDRRRALDRH